MIIEVYGRQDCKLCSSAKKKIAVMLGRWELADKVEVVFQDMDTIDGAAEGDFFDVFDIPTVLVRDGDEIIARWDHQAPPSNELQEALQSLGKQAA